MCLTGATPAISHTEARQIVNEYFEKLEARINAENIEKGKTFLEENKKNPNVKVLPSGLQYEVIREGNGKHPKATDQVRCHYEGTLIDGTLFDSSVRRGQPAVFGVNQVIKGWVEALPTDERRGQVEALHPFRVGIRSCRGRRDDSASQHADIRGGAAGSALKRDIR